MVGRATPAANGVIGGPIAGNWIKIPTRGKEIGCPPEMTLENRVAQIAKEALAKEEGVDPELIEGS